MKKRRAKAKPKAARDPRWTRVVGVALALPAAVVALLGLASLFHFAKVQVLGNTAVGRVVETVAIPARRRPNIRRVIEFDAGGGRTVRFESSIASNGPGFKNGDLVDVAYLPAAPDVAEVRDPRVYIGGAALFVFGAFVVALGVALACAKAPDDV